jgi:single-strand DNA-binding protein
LAINRTWTDQRQSGEKREATTFVDCKAWGKQGEILTRYCKKGSALFVEGRLDYRTWETNGEKRSKHEVVVENFQFVGAAKGEGQGAEPRWEATAAAGGGGGYRRPAPGLADPQRGQDMPPENRPATIRARAPTTSRSSRRGSSPARRLFSTLLRRGTDRP